MTEINKEFKKLRPSKDILIEELEQQNSALLAQIEELREALIKSKRAVTSYSGAIHVKANELADISVVINRALNATKEQSLSSLKSSVEEEVIGRCSEIALEVGRGKIKTTQLYQTYESIKSMPRKYKEEG